MAHVSRRAVSPFLATCLTWHGLTSMAVGTVASNPPALASDKKTLKSTRKPVVLLGNLPRSRRRLQPQSLKTKTLSVDTMTRRRKWPRSCHILPFSDIFGHFVKKIYTSPGNLFCFNNFARSWPTPWRAAVAGRDACPIHLQNVETLDVGPEADASMAEPCPTSPLGVVIFLA